MHTTRMSEDWPLGSVPDLKNNVRAVFSLHLRDVQE